MFIYKQSLDVNEEDKAQVYLRAERLMSATNSLEICENALI